MAVGRADRDIECGRRLFDRQAGEIPELNLSLKAEQTDIGKLAVILAGAEGIEGRIENAEFTALGRGTNPQAIIDGLDMRFAVCWP